MPISSDGWNYADVWEVVGELHPDAPFTIQGDRVVTWGAATARADGVARALLGAGLGHQDKVAQYLYNCPEYLEAIYAAFKAGLVPVNTNYRYLDDELAYLWDNADVRAVVFHATFTETIERMRPRVPDIGLWLWVDDGAGPCPEWATPYEVEATSAGASVTGPRSGDDLILMYTGGTTGKPKGVMWRQDDLLLVNNRTARVRFPEDADRDTVARLLSKPGPRHMPVVPLMHGLGQFTTFSAFCSAGAGVLLPGRRFDAVELLDTVERHRVNSIAIAGDAIARPMLEALEAEPDRWDLSSLRVVSSSGAMWSEVVKTGLSKQLPSSVLVDTLGSSEAIGLGVSVSKADSVAETARFQMGDDARVLADDGTWVEPGSGVRGLLARKGPTSIGYYKDAEKTAATYRVIDGVRWSTPGDYALVDADGSITLLGRGSNCINTGGEKVYPEEVEEVLKQHPSVRDAIVLGVADERLGERIVAAVELEAGDSFDEAAIVAHVRAKLASFKSPREIRAVPSLERQATGKLDYPAWKRRFGVVVPAQSSPLGELRDRDDNQRSPAS